MRSRLLLSCALVAGLVGLFAAIGYPEDDPAAPAEQAGSKSPHQVFGLLDGRWSVASRVWLDGQEEPIVSEARARNDRILDGKFLRMHYTGTFAGKHYYATGLMGYCMESKQYQLVWVSSHSTGMDLMNGQLSEDGQTITFKFMHRSTKGELPCRIAYTIRDPNNFLVESWLTCGSGEDSQSQQLIFTRMGAPEAKDPNPPPKREG